MNADLIARLRYLAQEAAAGSVFHDAADALEAVERERDTAYAERNKVVVALAKHYPAGWLADPAEPDWPVLYIDLPTGQVSWHFTKAEMEVSGIALNYHSEWDGHTTEEKYRRLATLEQAR